LLRSFIIDYGPRTERLETLAGRGQGFSPKTIVVNNSFSPPPEKGWIYSPNKARRWPPAAGYLPVNKLEK
jgi:hypothetical protein